MPGRPRVAPAVAVPLSIGLVTLLLLFGPSFAARWIGDVPGATGEALFTLMVFAPMLALGLIGRRLSALDSPLWGEHPTRVARRGVALGIGGLTLALGYAGLAGATSAGRGGGFSVLLLLGLPVVALQVFAEEALFRGWLQPALACVTRGWVAVVLTATIFAMLHWLGGASDTLPLLNMLLGGLLFGLIAARDKGIAGAFAAHFGWNAGEQLLLGLDPNPGVGPYGALVDIDLIGPAHWGGSEQGLNASLGMAIALVAVLVPLILMRATERRTV